MKCPVCPLENVPIGAQTCPSCGTELLPLYRVNELGARYFNRALELTADGNLDAALENACTAVNLDARSIPARILLGKILWKKKQREEAVSNWSEVLSVSPDNEEAQSLIAEATKELNAARRKRFLARSTVAISVLVLAGGILLVSGLMNSTVSSLEASLASCKAEKASFQPGRSGEGGEELAAMQARIDAIERDFSAYRVSHTVSDSEALPLRERMANIEADRQNEDEAIAGLISGLGTIDGVIASQDGVTGTLIFSRGLFESGSNTLNAESETMLARVAGILKASIPALTVVVTGHTDNTQPKEDLFQLGNWQLGLERARKVAACLKENLGTCGVNLLVGSAGAISPPFPNDSKEGRARNRTTVLHLQPSGRNQ